MDRRPALNTSELCIHSPIGVRLVLQPLFVGASLPSFNTHPSTRGAFIAGNSACITFVWLRARMTMV